ncbi:MAG: membrane dipeptidase [Clostridia bacterium]|nr:membrane dipeptidase [Clostridia bacterium]
MNYFDLHCDTAFELHKRNLPFNNNELSVTAENDFNTWVQTFAIWISDGTENPFELYKKIKKDIKEKLKEKPENLTPIFSVEGGAVLENNIERIYTLKQDGIKMLTLTWNGENAIAGGCKTDKELTRFGKKVIEKLNKLKIATDLSHLNQKSFFDAVDNAEYPLATHSNCYEICPNPRNLTLEQIKLITEKHGIIGLTFYPKFLGENIFPKIYENIFLLCDKGYENHIALGSDFDGGQMDKSLDNIAKIPHLYDFLKNKGLKKALLNKIFYLNAYNFIAKL